jgi:hypothetical protein
MTILSVAQEVALKVGIEVPNQVYGSTDRTMQELLAMISDAGDMIANGHDWQNLSGIASLTGDGTNEDFALPADYERMLLESRIWSSATVGALTQIADEDKWLELIVQGTLPAINIWIIYGNQLHIKPPLGAGTIARYFYLSNNIWAASGVPRASINGDSNTFRLDEKLLRMATIWMWKASKGQAYAEQQADYEQRLARKVKADNGAKIIRVGSQRLPAGVTVAYPRNVG